MFLRSFRQAPFRRQTDQQHPDILPRLVLSATFIAAERFVVRLNHPRAPRWRDEAPSGTRGLNHARELTIAFVVWPDRWAVRPSQATNAHGRPGAYRPTCLYMVIKGSTRIWLSVVA